MIFILVPDVMIRILDIYDVLLLINLENKRWHILTKSVAKDGVLAT